MSDLETEIQPILRPMLLGRQVSLGIDEQVALRAWIVLRGIVFGRGGAASGAQQFYTSDDRRTFKDSLEPPDEIYLWLFHYKSPRWVARSNVANLGLHATPDEPPHHAQVITAFVGLFGFQILICRWPNDRRLELDSPHVREWQTATSSLWPNPVDLIAWPPSGGYLADDTIKPFMDRWMKGIPLQRAKPAI